MLWLPDVENTIYCICPGFGNVVLIVVLCGIVWFLDDDLYMRVTHTIHYNLSCIHKVNHSYQCPGVVVNPGYQ
jgi:hypothetical protein